MASFKCCKTETGKGDASEKEDISEYVATYMGELIDVTKNMEKDLRVLINKVLPAKCEAYDYIRWSLGLMKLVENVVRMDDDCEEDDIIDWNNEMDNDCEDDYVGIHDDCLKDDKGEDNDIPDCNHADVSIEHATTIVLEDVQCDDHNTTIILKDVECDSLVYGNPIVGDNGICSLNDNESREVFPSKVELKQALSLLALKWHFKIRVNKSCHARFEVVCKDKACKFAMCGTKLLEGDYCQVCMFHKVHMCTVDGLQGGYRIASTRLIGELMSPKL
ncbi:Uncharacterized protein TCM_024682 [Theobroma cacao]|uniref:Transposase MuDR plant domain-containing protein n=1 Tax=Theobroma cacao TaxID=3641 RepID=A0A061EX81_THECC|nr:Uncharacterized protein TCM_024682 [Theobroma cacao]